MCGIVGYVSENKIGKKGIEALVKELGKDNKVL